MLRITVLVSGGGTNLQAIIDSIESGRIQGAQIGCIISSNPNAYALERAKKHRIRARVISKNEYPDMAARTEALLATLKQEETDLIVLAGYMSVLQPKLVQAYQGRIINIHPSLIPKFCGAGFYGKKVHQAVLDAGETESGATVHYVDEGVDTGEIIVQKKVPVLEGDTADTLAARVLEEEHQLLTQAINTVIEKMNH
ncbi:phosphoribosylglycinamide formyltransferase [Clostridium aminobutyricum]|uniref:Phosphoribosylglycinamide formyltransferase n=1 Tax=Clostridium aminobutyricum TaxID=33953 RepID=A0A939D952_CLOAM|nr:phosphoribosylglycinamide formyltransferase [Clostridium aminobutyricum]MBN7773048.1 phosphoribosylglycinamide formyltransferase [Clostridium aminobutyricum]